MTVITQIHITVKECCKNEVSCLNELVESVKRKSKLNTRNYCKSMNTAAKMKIYDRQLKMVQRQTTNHAKNKK